MKVFFSIATLLLSLTFFGQRNGTITIKKEITDEHPTVRFAGLESGGVQLRGYMIDKCLEPNIGMVQHFEVVAEDRKGNTLWIKSDTSCFSGEHYEQLEEMGNGTQIEFMNIIGINSSGEKIIYPGMKFVIRKKS